MPGTLAVISQSGQSLSFYDVSSGEKTGHISDLIAEPHELCYDTNRNLLYVSHAYRHGHFWDHGDYSHEISVVDVAGKKVIGTIETSPALAPHGLLIDKDRDILYASVEGLPNEEGGGIIGINLGNRQVIKSVASKYRSHWFVMTTDGKKAYTCNKTASFISVLDLEKECMVGRIEVPGCEEPGISKDGRYAYFPTPGFSAGTAPKDPAIQVIDTTTDKVVRSINMDAGGHPLHVSPLGTILVGKHGFTPDSTPTASKFKAARLAIYDPEDYSLLGEVDVGLLTMTIRCSTDGQTAFVANTLPGTVSVVDIASKTVVRTIENDLKQRQDKTMHQGAHGMAFIP